MSHALVSFHEEDGQPTCTIPVRRLLDDHSLKKGQLCRVSWTDGRAYSARILGLGGYIIQIRTELCT